MKCVLNGLYYRKTLYFSRGISLAAVSTHRVEHGAEFRLIFIHELLTNGSGSFL